MEVILGSNSGIDSWSDSGSNSWSDSGSNSWNLFLGRGDYGKTRDKRRNYRKVKS